ncbi:unnamed protein product [Rotaria magnacalcarata]|nr:unnamed protein product [Rotaria magnacalcarata]CAF2055259.1 unnamed protein product [Rotaria magnacalcarata]CAF2123724.1 unnamed protein product [Rotaria magnacalcarata]CAF4016624.1 unnamed protein product [Rotaria magnacalcarata]CAF4090970.1 unnamed protein product [Rotaria magnacalcarata]
MDEDEAKQKRTSQFDSLVYEFLRLVQIDVFVRNELHEDLHEAMADKLSDGQNTRLLLARVFFRAHHRNASLLILEESDQGLATETTVSIIDNIME